MKSQQGGQMEYERVVPATFISRPNRFVAEVRIGKRVAGSDPSERSDPAGRWDPSCGQDLAEGQDPIAGQGIVRVHVKNTGRCRELLVPGAQVWLSPHDNPARKTRYSLIAVEKEGFGLVNMDSQAPNQVVFEALISGHIPMPEGKQEIRREFSWGNSRLDLALFETGAGVGKGDPAGNADRKASLTGGAGGVEAETAPEKPVLIEVKGVTLERNGRAFFPDAPTERGIKHIRELIRAKEEGHEAWILFVIQMKGISAFHPNDETHPAFGEALCRARDAGVFIRAFDCVVTPDSLWLDSQVPVCL